MLFNLQFRWQALGVPSGPALRLEASAAPSRVRWHRGAPGPRAKGKPQDAHLTQSLSSRQPVAHEKDGPPQMPISVPFAARTGKPRPTGTGTHPRSPSKPRPGGPVSRTAPRCREPYSPGRRGSGGGELAEAGNRAAARAGRGAAAVCRASGRGPLAAGRAQPLRRAAAAARGNLGAALRTQQGGG